MKKRLLLVFAVMMLLSGCSGKATDAGFSDVVDTLVIKDASVSVDQDLVQDTGFPVAPIINGIQVPSYDGENLWVIVNESEPFFAEDEKLFTEIFEEYSELDGLGRCGTAYATICRQLQPTEQRGEIGSVKPSGWHTVKYNGVVQGNYLYNRCHLIGFQLAGENANERNLITGTRAFNVDGMLFYENAVAEYIDMHPENHVLYRVTPYYDGDNLVASGVLMEACSMENDGVGLEFCVFVYNVQPGVGIDYATGESWLLDGKTVDVSGEKQDFVVNTSSGKFHLPSCRYADEISDENRVECHDTLDKMLNAGYSPCGSCRPDSVE